MNGKSMEGLFDTGSDITVAQQKALKSYEFGEMHKCNFSFDAVGSHNQTIGYVNVKVKVDDECYDDVCFIINDQGNSPEIIIGLSIINQAEVTINKNGITMKKMRRISNDCSKNDDEEATKNDDEWNLNPMCALIL